MDFRAKAFRRELERRGRLVAPNPWLETEPWALYIEGVKQSRLDALKIAERVSRQDILQYWERKGRVSPGTIDTIDWTAVGKGMDASPWPSAVGIEALRWDVLCGEV